MQHNNSFLSLVEQYRSEVKETNVSAVANNLNNFILIDVREDHEWLKGHIDSAIHLSKGVIELHIESRVPEKSAEIVLYCGGGYRSILAAYNLQKMGYTNVFSMVGGIKAWTLNGFALVND